MNRFVSSFGLPAHASFKGHVWDAVVIAHLRKGSRAPECSIRRLRPRFRGSRPQ